MEEEEEEVWRENVSAPSWIMLASNTPHTQMCKSLETCVWASPLERYKTSYSII